MTEFKVPRPQMYPFFKESMHFERVAGLPEAQDNRIFVVLTGLQ